MTTDPASDPGNEPRPAEHQPAPPPLTPAQRKTRRILLVVGTIAMLGIGVCTALLLLFLVPPTPSDGEMIVKTLSMARLGPLPPDATDVETGGDNSLFKMTLLLRFKAPPQQIDGFLRNSPALQDLPTEILGPRHMFQPFPANGQGDPAHRHYLPDPRHDWWNPLVQTRGRFFEIPPDDDQVRGQVIVDDTAHEVFVKVERGAS